MAYKYIKPVASRVTQTFGSNPDYYARFGQKGHNGIDYGSQTNTPVKAVADGVVAFEGWGQNHAWMGRVAGISIILRHASHYSDYAHLSRTVVNRGQRVRKGQIIGYTGMTGTASGPHLHSGFLPLTVNLYNGFWGRIDPRPLFKLLERPTGFLVKTTSPAWVRKSPYLRSNKVKLIGKGYVFTAVAVVSGASVSGNNKWYKTSRGNYVWSGNCKRV